MAAPGLQRREGSAPQGGAPEDGAEEAPRAKRWRKRFTFQEDVRDSRRDPKTVTMTELRIGEIDAAYDAGGGNRNRVAQELAKLAIVKLDGKKVTLEEVEERWPTFSQKARMQCVVAYDDMHNTSKEQDRAFLDSAVADDDE